MSRCALLVALAEGGADVLSTPIAFGLTLAVELALALVLVRPWSAVHGGITARDAAMLVVLATVLVPPLVSHQSSRTGAASGSRSWRTAAPRRS